MVLGFVGFLVKTDRLLVDPRVGFERGKHRRQPRRFIPTIEEVARLLDAIEPVTPMAIRDRAILELFYSTGLRRGELHRLDLYDLDLRRCQVHVREGKGGQDRIVPFGARARAALEDYLKEARPLWWTPAAGEAVFLSRRGFRMHHGSIGRMFHLWRRRLGLPFLTAHRLRHACATHLLLRGADMRFVQQMMGHREITTTQRYTHLVPMDLVEVHKKTHPRGMR
jgi:integrase/recombinase XerD